MTPVATHVVLENGDGSQSTDGFGGMASATMLSGGTHGASIGTDPQPAFDPSSGRPTIRTTSTSTTPDNAFEHAMPSDELAEPSNTTATMPCLPVTITAATSNIRVLDLRDPSAMVHLPLSVINVSKLSAQPRTLFGPSNSGAPPSPTDTSIAVIDALETPRSLSPRVPSERDVLPRESSAQSSSDPDPRFIQAEPKPTTFSSHDTAPDFAPSSTALYKASFDPGTPAFSSVTFASGLQASTSMLPPGPPSSWMDAPGVLGPPAEILMPIAPFASRISDFGLTPSAPISNSSIMSAPHASGPPRMRTKRQNSTTRFVSTTADFSFTSSAPNSGPSQSSVSMTVPNTTGPPESGGTMEISNHDVAEHQELMQTEHEQGEDRAETLAGTTGETTTRAEEENDSMSIATGAAAGSEREVREDTSVDVVPIGEPTRTISNIEGPSMLPSSPSLSIAAHEEEGIRLLRSLYNSSVSLPSLSESSLSCLGSPTAAHSIASNGLPGPRLHSSSQTPSPDRLPLFNAANIRENTSSIPANNSQQHESSNGPRTASPGHLVVGAVASLTGSTQGTSGLGDVNVPPFDEAAMQKRLDDIVQENVQQYARAMSARTNSSTKRTIDSLNYTPGRSPGKYLESSHRSVPQS